MRLIIEARMEDEQTSSMATETTIVAVLERQERSIADLALTLPEGRALLAKVQSVLVSHQTADWMAGQQACCRCGSMLAKLLKAANSPEAASWTGFTSR